MNYTLLIPLAISLFIIELLYFRLADRFNIIDKPNQRSSHTRITIRGGGVVFYMAAIAYFFYFGFPLPYFFVGLTIVTVISFYDDISSVSSGVRSALQLTAMLLMAYQLDAYMQSWWILACFFVLAVGILNAYNFMDGINGITGIYSLITLLSLAYLNTLDTITFTDTQLPVWVAVGVAVFNFFNCRPKAKCFAGDVGSVSVAFIVIYLLAGLIFQAKNIYYILLLGVYGVDSVLTIVQRLMRRENIFQPHRTHLYQVLANETKIPHVNVSIIYGIIQLIINVIVFQTTDLSGATQTGIAAAILLSLAVLYWTLKSYLLRRHAAQQAQA
ncbi:UDP-N-acetylmuramyl pentapeptide phosphotransferase/UDP-N-acetylglucosamine-1-phosphate transferase [Flexibacter flexilis DSM 6793]|uniref:UDP-N-acetylmuramyl pentapeptide phosphotransferase/UDP-N-acetylglucosamine-1-phosphate transferase n=1 Tax=Flexibacter flexilis DSM 6793 TaxID=927664 RepID=A0A1I1LBG1_9BACT|nr:glycosyltransferase family 4 protein [Flexibacter flexilis]SFC69862.1 UDP-N-acetylmuramyl pentapeptide phosphotransferase/UDP-N-acetylglucosamine-1-phosphate transferase [Flexibacter flexilis DSM 6793]